MASADDKTPDDINVTPMVDLYLVLLLIFIVMTAAGVKGMKVELP
jgi:biopolymer transport protein ExbD